MRPTISLIGAGKVGYTLARLWFDSGYTIKAVYNRTLTKAQTLAQYIDAQAVTTLIQAVAPADLICLTVPDDTISPLAEQLADFSWQGKAVIHASGAHSIDVLQPLADAGAMVGSLHPAFPFADPESAYATLVGAIIAIEASDERLQVWLRGLVTALKGDVLVIPAGQKARYHASLVIASNYMVTLYAVAQGLLRDLGAEPQAVDNALLTLMQATLTNIAEQGIPTALTGPLTRADISTLQAHLDALDDPNLRQAYIALARLAYPMLAERGVDIPTIERLLQENS
ncbi:MAG: Rossmann-like and DUF2520 domain-containing protein [Anaerolineae bacterium]